MIKKKTCFHCKKRRLEKTMTEHLNLNRRKSTWLCSRCSKKLFELMRN